MEKLRYVMTLLNLVAVASSFLVVTAPNTVISVLWLVVVFVTTSLLLGLTGLGYAALLYVIVYVGAIAIIFLFVVQLLGGARAQPGSANSKFAPTANNWARLLPTPLQGNTNSGQELKLSQQDNNSDGKDIANHYSTAENLVAKGSATLPIATVISLSIIYILYCCQEFTFTWIAPEDIGYLEVNHEQLSAYSFSLISWMYELFTSGPATGELNNFSACFTYHPAYFNINGYTTSQVYNLAEWLYGGAFLPLIIASIILLLAMIAPIVLCKVNEPNFSQT